MLFTLAPLVGGCTPVQGQTRESCLKERILLQPIQKNDNRKQFYVQLDYTYIYIYTFASLIWHNVMSLVFHSRFLPACQTTRFMCNIYKERGPHLPIRDTKGAIFAHLIWAGGHICIFYIKGGSYWHFLVDRGGLICILSILRFRPGPPSGLITEHSLITLKHGSRLSYSGLHCVNNWTLHILLAM